MSKNDMKSTPLWHPAVRKLATTPLGAAIFSYAAPWADRILYQLTRGKYTLTTLLSGLPVLLVKITGARSGKQYSIPLTPILDGEKIILLASNFGAEHHPGWYYNLLVNPSAIITQNGNNSMYQARIAEGQERTKYWKLAVELYAGYAAYEKKAGNRIIPVIVMEPDDK